MTSSAYFQLLLRFRLILTILLPGTAAVWTHLQNSPLNVIEQQLYVVKISDLEPVFAGFTLLIGIIKSPASEAANDAQTMTLPPPSFTVGMKFCHCLAVPFIIVHSHGFCFISAQKQRFFLLYINAENQ